MLYSKGEMSYMIKNDETDHMTDVWQVTEGDSVDQWECNGMNPKVDYWLALLKDAPPAHMPS